MRITSRGQVTIPKAIRELAGLLPRTEVEFEFDGAVVRLAPATTHGPRTTVASLRGKGDVAMSTDQIMALTRGG